MIQTTAMKEQRWVPPDVTKTRLRFTCFSASARPAAATGRLCPRERSDPALLTNSAASCGLLLLVDCLNVCLERCGTSL